MKTFTSQKFFIIHPGLHRILYHACCRHAHTHTHTHTHTNKQTNKQKVKYTLETQYNKIPWHQEILLIISDGFFSSISICSVQKVDFHIFYINCKHNAHKQNHRVKTQMGDYLLGFSVFDQTFTMSAVKYHQCKYVNTMEPGYTKDFDTMKITLLYLVSGYIRVKKKEEEKKRAGTSKISYLVLSSLFITRFHCTLL